MSKIPDNETVYDRIRRRAKEEAEANAPTGKPLEERLHMTPTTAEDGGRPLEERLNQR